MSTTPPNHPGDEGTVEDAEQAAVRRSRRTFAPTLLIGVPAAAVAALAANKPLLVSPMLTGDRYADVGTIPLAGSLALVPLVAWAALVLLRGKGRVFAAIVGLATSVGALAAADAGLDGTHDAMARTFRELGQEGSFSSGFSGWFWVMGVACLVTALAFFVATRHAPAWPALSRKYDAPSRPRPATEPTSNQELWKAIDDGRDPTTTTTLDDN
jgi:hypothetical protein